jgi:GntR family transcriptional repressor for pyruvate dehydrogenase complex
MTGHMATRRRKLYEVLMGEILAAIVDGEYPEGSRLPKEEDLAARHDVSRYVARECIQALGDRGVLTVKHGVGSTIRPRDDWQLFDPILIEAMLSGPERDDVGAEVAECRRIVWPEVAAVAAKRRSKADLAALEAAEDDEEAFRAALLNAAGNRFLRHVLTSLHATGEPAAAPAPRRRAGTLESLCTAIAERDAETSRELMRRRVG